MLNVKLLLILPWQKNMCFTGVNKVLQDLNDSVKFMSKKFNEFSVQVKDFISAVKEIKDENKKLKE